MPIDVVHVRLVTLPEHDLSFRECVQGLIELAALRSTNARAALRQVQRTARQRCPAAVVREERRRRPADPIVWYAHRDGPTTETGAVPTGDPRADRRPDMDGHWFG
jgi:hypothetical protein